MPKYVIEREIPGVGKLSADYATPLRAWGCERIVARYEELEEL
jgi:hypothetical protein